MNLKTQQLSSLEQVRSFMAGTDAVLFTTQAHQDRYQWVALSLKQFAYARLRRAERGLIVRFRSSVRAAISLMRPCALRQSHR